MVETSHDSPSRKLNTNSPPVEWKVFDPKSEVDVTARNRPHWDQSGALTFVTIRLADSMPKVVVERWLAELRDFLERNGVDTRGLDSESRATMAESRAKALPDHLQRAFRKFKNQRWHENLDNCHGSCLLQKPEFAAIVAESLLKFDDERYHLERFVVMPNHVHLLVQMRAGWGLREQCESWMRFTGRKINSLRDAKGEFWSEPFDHIVRSAEQFEYLKQYIVENPGKANLAEGDYLLWVRGLEFVPWHSSPHRVNLRPHHDSESRATEGRTEESTVTGVRHPDETKGT